MSLHRRGTSRREHTDDVDVGRIERGEPSVRRTLQAYVLSRLEREPDSRAITFLNDRGEHAWYSVRGFVEQASGYAAFLSDSGLKKGGVCIVVLSSGEVAAKIVLACVLLGAVPLLVAPPSLQTEGAFSSLSRIVRGIIRKTRPDVVIVDDSLRGMAADVETTRDGVHPLMIAEGDLESREGKSWSFESVTETDLAGLQLTSGTTGFPKVCVWRQDRVIAALEGMAASMGLTRHDTCLNWTPLYHDMGLVNNFLLCLALGVPLAMMRPQDFVRDPSLWLRGLADLQATTTWSPNFGFAIAAQRCREEDLTGVDLGHVRAFWNAAERIHYDTMMGFYSRFRVNGVRLESLKTNFGCAENVGGATFCDLNGAFVFERLDRSAFLEQRIARVLEDSGDQQHAVVIVSAGKHHPQLTVQILSEDGAPLPDGEIGEVALHSPSRMNGYLDDPEATQRAFAGELLRTGDLGYLRDGELFWVGRVQERINVRGVKLDPSDLEPILFAIQGLRPGCFAAFGLDDEAKGTQRIVIVTELRDAWRRMSAEVTDEIRNRVFLTLGVNVDDVLLVREGTLTKTSSGKRRHRFVKDLYERGRLAEYLLPQSVNGASRPHQASCG